ncbi:MAG: hypothetical protein OXC14_17320 [Rhodospirillaceae bacterium]|nr:hypothetical protein [Rhodospirillaceae bacterium]
MNARQAYDQRADYDAFVEQLPELLKTHEGKVVVIHDRSPVSFHDTVEQAVEAGNKTFGAECFIAQEVVPQEPLIASYSLAI